MSSTDILRDILTHSIMQFYYRPAALDDTIFVHLSNNEKVIRKFSEQSRDDWEKFLENRAKELAPGNVESQYIAVQNNMALHIETTIVECAQRPISQTLFSFFHSMENVFWRNSIVGYHIATKFCACSDSTAAVPCEKFHHTISKTWMRAELNFHQIWITMEKSFVKWTLGFELKSHPKTLGGV